MARPTKMNFLFLTLCLMLALTSATETQLRGSTIAERELVICDDSNVFRATVDGKLRDCEWVSHRPSDRCNVVGEVGNGHHVTAKNACFRSCDTGNCRRRE